MDEAWLHRQSLTLPPQKIQVEIALGEGLLQSGLTKVCRSTGRRIAIVADAAIVSTHGKLLKEMTRGTLLPFIGGEGAKTRESKQKFENELLRKQFGRDTLLIGLGGGVVTDFTAFLAATYMRGIPFILVPTTLLAMVDAAIGGKCGVDTPFGKNLIGATYQPTHIFIDPSLLASLPEQEWTYGLSEILKYGLIADSCLWELLEQNPLTWKQSLSALLLSSIRVKKKIVEQDPLETGLRRILNFGHTIAHALELLSHFKMPHGEAVAIGCIAESFLSHQLGYLSFDAFTRIKALFQTFSFSFKLPRQFAAKPMLDAMQIDKKAKARKPRFVLIDRIGHAMPFDGTYCRTAPAAVLETLIQERLCINI